MNRMFLRHIYWLCLSLLVLGLAACSAPAQSPINVSATAGPVLPDWCPAPGDESSPAQAALSASVSPPTAPYGCTLEGPLWNWTLNTPNVLYSTDDTTWTQAPANSYTWWIVQNQSTATLYIVYYIGGYWQFPCSVGVSYDDQPCGDTWFGTSTCNANGTSIQLIGLTVVSGATQQNTVGGANWAAVKQSLGTVVIQATTLPNSEIPWTLIRWSGGNFGLAANQRTVDKSTSAETQVTASIGSWFLFVNIWILWVDIQVLTVDPKPPNAPSFSYYVDGTEKLGAVTWNNGNSGAGKICSVGTITPAGVQDVVTSGWDFTRDKWRHNFKDGAQVATSYDSDWVPDDEDNDDEMNTPDTTDKIYDIDAPNIDNFGQTDSYERYINFREYVLWNGQMCSDYTGWYYEARWKKNNAGTNQVTLNVVSTGALNLNNFTTAFYPPPGGGGGCGGGCPPCSD